MAAGRDRQSNNPRVQLEEHVYMALWGSLRRAFGVSSVERSIKRLSPSFNPKSEIDNPQSGYGWKFHAAFRRTPA